MYPQSDRLLMQARQFEIQREIERARIEWLARRPRRGSMRRSLGRRMMRLGARLAADPALRQARTS